MSLRPWTAAEPAGYLAETERLLATVEPRLRAFTHVTADRSHGGGPLAGMPVAVKEIIDVAGMPVTCGSTTLAGRVPSTDATAVARLSAAGAVVVGITTSTPFACGTTTVTDHPTRPGHTPGGSSAGSAAAVGAGIVPVALASQSQASTIRPASYCGAWGFKPSHGALPRDGMHLLSETLDDLGVVAASLDDLEAVFTTLIEPVGPQHVPPTSLRVGRLLLDDGGLPRPETRAALDALVALVAPLAGVEVVDGTPDLRSVDAALQGSGQSCFDIFAGESAPTLAGHVAAGERDPRLRELVEHAETIGPEGLARALAHRAELRTAWATLASSYDVLLTLATTNPAPEGHASTGCRRLPATASLLGVPALTAPWLEVDGLPQGVQLIGFEGRDDALLAAARRLDDLLEEAR
ncbi:amidase [Nocardioides sp. W7]|uniref:amidase n=1 Tax=Nocardioides sp. W7 TaxID=2931390 RepID=UPI001FD0393A|nr:amidase [Nocardioides sp. W7]